MVYNILIFCIQVYYFIYICIVFLQNVLYYMDLGDVFMYVVGLVVCEVFVQFWFQFSFLYFDIFNFYFCGVNFWCYFRCYERLIMDGEKYIMFRDIRDCLE